MPTASTPYMPSRCTQDLP